MVIKGISTQSTVRDVARSANVSIATVSRVINGTCPVSDKLKLRVLSAITALEYSPNTFAAHLSRNGGMPKRRLTREVQPDSLRRKRPPDLGAEHRTPETLKAENERLRKSVGYLRRKLTECKMLIDGNRATALAAVETHSPDIGNGTGSKARKASSAPLVGTRRP